MCFVAMHAQFNRKSGIFGPLSRVACFSLKIPAAKFFVRGGLVQNVHNILSSVLQIRNVHKMEEKAISKVMSGYITNIAYFQRQTFRHYFQRHRTLHGSNIIW